MGETAQRALTMRSGGQAADHRKLRLIAPSICWKVAALKDTEWALTRGKSTLHSLRWGQPKLTKLRHKNAASAKDVIQSCTARGAKRLRRRLNCSGTFKISSSWSSTCVKCYIGKNRLIRSRFLSVIPLTQRWSIFFCPSPLPFGSSTVLSLTRGPAGNRTTTGSLSHPEVEQITPPKRRAIGADFAAQGRPGLSGREQHWSAPLAAVQWSMASAGYHVYLWVDAHFWSCTVHEIEIICYTFGQRFPF